MCLFFDETAYNDRGEDGLEDTGTQVMSTCSIMRAQMLEVPYYLNDQLLKVWFRHLFRQLIVGRVKW